MKKIQWLRSSLRQHSRRSPNRRRPHIAAERLEERCVLTTNTWATALGGSANDVPVGITATGDGGYAVVGNTDSFDAENGDVWLTRFDSAGGLLWARQYGQSLNVALRGTGDQPFRDYTYDRATDIEATENGGFRISGYSEFAPGNAKIGWAMEIDSTGVVVAMAGRTFIASDQYTSLSNGTIGGNSIVFTPTSYRFVATIGNVRYGGLQTETTLSQLSSDGVVVGSQGVLNGQTLVASPSGGAVVFGFGESGVSITKTPTDGTGNSYYGVASVHYEGVGNQATYSVIRKLTTDFSPVWEVSLPGDTVTSIQALPDGGFVVALISNRASITNGSSSNVMLVKLDADGDLVWAKTYGGLGAEGFVEPFRTTVDLVVTTDGFAFATSTNSFGTDDAIASSFDYWVVKTDLEGNIPILSGVMRDVTADVVVSPFFGSFDTGVFQNLGPIVGPTDPTFSTFYFYSENDPGPVYTPLDRVVAYGGPSSVATTTIDVVPRVQSTTAYNAGAFQFASASYQTTEDSFDDEGMLTNFVDVVVTRTDATHGAYGTARVNYSVTFNGSTSSGDATFINPSGGIAGGTYYLEFPDGVASQTFRVYGFLDNDFDPGDSLTLTLSDPDLLNGAEVGALASTTITILNTNPAPGTVQFSAASYTVDENKQSVTVTVTRTNASETDMQVSYAVIGGTASGGNAPPADYNNSGTSGTFTFSSNATSKTFTIPIFDDPDIEGDETIQLQLSNPTNGGLLGTIATTTVTIRDIQPVPQTIIPKFNGKIAFVRSSNIGGNSPDLILMNSNGSSVTNITNSADVHEMSPAWSPDGSKLVYVAIGSEGPNDITGINVINVDGTGRVQLTQDSSDSDPTWSPDGTRIAFVRFDNGKKLMVMNADGSNVELILADIYIGQPRWSPNGTHIAYEGRSPLTDADAIFEIGTDGFGKHMLFSSVGSTINSATDGSYTPDGTEMIFRGVDLSREGRTDGIYRANVDGTGTPERLADGEFQLFLSPEGNRLAFGSTAGSFPRIVLSNLDSTQAVNLTDGSDGDHDPVWQPLLSALPPDTQAPTVLSVTPNTVTIDDDFIGTANFSLTVVFSEGMNTSVAPTLSFPVENPNSTLTFNADESGWLFGSTTYVAKYNVVDANKTLSNIDVRVSGGEDLTGNDHVSTTLSNKFDIAMAGTFSDMTPPFVESFERFNPLAIQTTASTLVFSVTFSESVDTATVDATDFSVNGSTATITSVTPVAGTFGLSFDVTVSGGNLASYFGTVGLDVRLTSDILDTVGLPLTHFGPFVDEVYQHSPSAPNRIPSFTKGASQTVLEDSGLKSVTTWATAISPGTGASDIGQTLDFIVTNNNNALFNVQPTIATNGTLTFTPAANANGVATITVRIHDNGGIAIGGIDTSAAQTFTITIKSVNDFPTATVIAPQTIAEDTSTGPLTFTIGDVETPAANLTLAALSSTNTKLIPLSRMTFGGSGANRTVTVTPVANQFGSSTIAFTIKDANGGVLTQNVLINVTPVNDGGPSITTIANVITNEDTPTAAIKFTVTDIDDALVNLNAIIVTATSSNADLVPNSSSNIVLGGSLGARTIQLKPALDKFGTTTITVTAKDSDNVSTTRTFTLTVNSVNDVPRVTAATFSVSEIMTNNFEVGTVQAADPEGAAITAYSILGGNTNNAFKIDNNGVIRVNDASKIDFETLAKYTLTIKATDANGGFSSKANETGPITINVTNEFVDRTVDAVNSDNTVTVLRVGNNLVARRGAVDLFSTAVEEVGTLTINGGTAKDTVILDASLNTAGTSATKKFTGQIVVNGGEGDDRLDASKITVTTIGITFNGGSGNDSALGGSGHDRLNGDDGDDSLIGNAGNDSLTGGNDNDRQLGGTGNDTYFFADTAVPETDTLTELSGTGTGIDTLDFSSVTSKLNVDLILEVNMATHTNRTVNTSATGTTKLSGNFENVIGGSGDDEILGNLGANNLQGGLGNDSLDGDSGNDNLNGGDNDDVIRGNAGNDIINGGTGSDTLLGEAGNDTIHGNAGDDTLIGGLGADQLFGDEDNDLGLGGRGGAARGGTGVKDSGDVLNASIETINEAFSTIFAFE